MKTSWRRCRVTRKFICDVCGSLIETPQEGMFEWLNLGNGQGRGLRIVHRAIADIFRAGHQYKEGRLPADAIGVGDIPLRDAMGPDGLMWLVEKLATGAFPKDEAIRMLLRLHMPWYEYAAPYLQQALDDDVYELRRAFGFLNQSELREVVRWAAEYGESDYVTWPIK